MTGSEVTARLLVVAASLERTAESDAAYAATLGGGNADCAKGLRTMASDGRVGAAALRELASLVVRRDRRRYRHPAAIRVARMVTR